MMWNEWLDRNTIISDKKLLIFALSFLTALLIRIADIWSEAKVAWVFSLSFLVFLFVTGFLIRQQVSEAWRYKERNLFQSRWGTFGVALLGFGVGALVHNRQEWFRRLWRQFRRIDTPEEWVLVSLFLLGVMLGFFVVRNWSKNQQEFLSSLTAVLGAAFLATIVGTLGNNLSRNQPAVNPPARTGTPVQDATGASARTPAAAGATTTTPAVGTSPPAAGTTAPAATAPPGAAGAAAPGATAPAGGAATTQTGTTAATAPAGAAAPTTPGGEGTAPPAAGGTAPTQPVGENSGPYLQLDAVRTFAFYALGFTLSGALNLIAFALLIGHYSRTRSLTSRSVIDFLYGSDKAQGIDGYFLKNFEADPDYARVKLETALKSYREIIRLEFARKMDRRKDSSGEVPPPLEYFELLSIQSVPPGDPVKDTYEVVFRKLRKSEPGDAITAAMFRVAISMRWQDNLEYVVAPGEYRQSFPYYGSVAGLSLLARRTIVMNRDQHRRFRTGNYVDGRTPSQADQPRGLYDIDYLSYISVPMASSLGKPEEQSLGVLHIDTKLFACLPDKVPYKDTDRVPDADPGQEIYKVREEVDKGKRLIKFEDYASNLYLQNDPIVEDLVKMKDVIIPLLELYKKCRTGALNEPKPPV